VDDEPVILQLLELSVAAMKAVWDPAFAPSAEAALDLLGEAPFDVVV
jgi:hypothetical protein